MIISKLTDIEFSLLMCIVQGMTSNEIAAILGKSTSTINNQIIELRKKTGHNSRTSLAADYLQSTIARDCLHDEIDILTAKIAACEAKAQAYRTIQQIKQVKLKSLNDSVLPNVPTDTL